MQFGQFVGYNARNIFYEKSCAKYGRETSFRPFSKKSKSGVFLDQQLEHLRSLFLLYVQVEDCQIILKLK